jgi:hypothetical protein
LALAAGFFVPKKSWTWRIFDFYASRARVLTSSFSPTSSLSWTLIIFL